MTIKAANTTKKEYAERPFTINGLIGSQFTIEEKLGMGDLPRTATVPTKDQKRTFQVVVITVNDGLFKKDLQIYESDWVNLCTALPGGLVSLQGVTLKPIRDANNPLKVRFEYIGTARQDMDGAAYNNGNHATDQDTPTTIGNMVKALHAEIEKNVNNGVKNTPDLVIKAAEKIKPGDALGLIQAAKEAGWIVEVGGVIRGT